VLAGAALAVAGGAWAQDVKVDFDKAWGGRSGTATTP
jgi:hypothetical protein